MIQQSTFLLSDYKNYGTYTTKVQVWKKNHFVKIVTSLIAILLKITLCLFIYFLLTKNSLF